MRTPGRNGPRGAIWATSLRHHSHLRMVLWGCQPITRRGPNTGFLGPRDACCGCPSPSGWATPLPGPPPRGHSAPCCPAWDTQQEKTRNGAGGPEEGGTKAQAGRGARGSRPCPPGLGLTGQPGSHSLLGAHPLGVAEDKLGTWGVGLQRHDPALQRPVVCRSPPGPPPPAGSPFPTPPAPQVPSRGPHLSASPRAGGRSHPGWCSLPSRCSQTTCRCCPPRMGTGLS